MISRKTVIHLSVGCFSFLLTFFLMMTISVSERQKKNNQNKANRMPDIKCRSHTLEQNKSSFSKDYKKVIPGDILQLDLFSSEKCNITEANVVAASPFGWSGGIVSPLMRKTLQNRRQCELGEANFNLLVNGVQRGVHRDRFTGKLSCSGSGSGSGKGGPVSWSGTSKFNCDTCPDNPKIECPSVRIDGRITFPFPAAMGCNNGALCREKTSDLKETLLMVADKKCGRSECKSKQEGNQETSSEQESDQEFVRGDCSASSSSVGSYITSIRNGDNIVCDCDCRVSDPLENPPEAGGSETILTLRCPPTKIDCKCPSR